MNQRQNSKDRWRTPLNVKVSYLYWEPNFFFLNELFSGFETSGHISLSILCLIKFIILLITETEISFGLAALMKRSCSLVLNYPTPLFKK